MEKINTKKKGKYISICRYRIKIHVYYYKYILYIIVIVILPKGKEEKGII